MGSICNDNPPTRPRPGPPIMSVDRVLHAMKELEAAKGIWIDKSIETYFFSPSTGAISATVQHAIGASDNLPA